MNKIINFSKITFVFIVYLTVLPVALSNTLTPFKAEYIAYRWGENLGSATIELEKLAANQYSLLYQSKVAKFFLSDKRAEHSIFGHINGVFTPKEYHYSRTGTGSDKSLHVKFDDQSQQIQITKDGNNFELPWENESDNQLYRLMMPAYIKQGKTNFDVNFINYRGEKKLYRMESQGEESLTLPYGVVAAVKVKIVRKNSSRQTYAWFAPSLNYQLVRLQQFKNDKEQGDIQLAAYSQ